VAVKDEPTGRWNQPPGVARLRRVVLTMAGLNLGHFVVALTVALSAGSVALLAASVDLLADTSVNLLVWLALSRPAARRSVAAKVMALIILAPAALAAVRHHGGSLSRAAFLSARNDVLVDLAMIVMAAVTAWTRSGRPDVVLGCFILAPAAHAAHEVREVSEAERLATKAPAGGATD
jgi:Co/Zn/Cd efflux system component